MGNEKEGLTAESPNDPTRVEYGASNAPVMRGIGATPSERYLAKLADRSFLNLWSYPNTFIDKRVRGKGDGKELCDLLVVCGDHILIFSDKTVAWPDGAIDLAWTRWYKRAIAKSVDQIRGAERWIYQFPDRIFLDRACTQRLPINLPPPERRKVHGIAVALGAGEACMSYFNEGIGSFFLLPDVKGHQHFDQAAKPFVIGDVDPDGPFVHVLDDATLDIVLGELDTISDLAAYLTKKEQLIRSGAMLLAAGEEELVAYYMTHMNSFDEHDFTKPDRSNFKNGDHVSFAIGFYDGLKTHSQYLAKKEADRASYAWDVLIELFTTNMLAGKTIVPDGASTSLSELERGIRHMALVPRYKRRLFGEAIIGVLEQSHTTDRFSRSMLPGPTEKDQDTGFFFMTLAIPQFELEGGYEGYRKGRRNFLKTYAFALLEKHRTLKRVVGIATEPRNENSQFGSSEDLVFVEAGEWTEKFLEQLQDAKRTLNIFQDGGFTIYQMQGSEFPEVSSRPSDFSEGYGSKRKRRRAKGKARRGRKSA